MRIVIPSRKRVNACRDVLKLFPGALVVVHQEEVEDYSGLDAELLAHPPEVAGIAPLKNWILDNVPDETVFIVDDDISMLKAMGGRPRKSAPIRDPAVIRQVVENAAQAARVLGTPVFGFNQNGGDVRKFSNQDPIGMSGWVGGAMGIIGRELRYDSNLKLRADIDFCLQAQLRFRCIYSDLRFAFVEQRFNNTGGNAHMRSAERNRRELAYLRQKWGRWISLREGKGTVMIKVHVKRRQNLVIIS
jgi:hypothetical protein